MKAIIQDRYGASDVLSLSDLDIPIPREEEVLVRVRAAAINALDWHYLRGDPYIGRVALGWRGPRKRVRGRDFAGVVEAIGARVTRFRVGDEVYGEADGSLAEYARAKADEIEHKPSTLSFEQAAAVPVAGITALTAVRDLGQVRRDQRVLINGASGGVGTFAVQIAKAADADVSGVCSERNAELVRLLGADRVIDYRAEDFTRGSDRYDVVLDLVCTRSLSDLRRALTPEGMLVLVGGGTPRTVLGPVPLMLHAAAVSPFVRHRLRPLSVKPSAEKLAALRDLIDADAVMPTIDRTYPLVETAEALRYLEIDHARAKVVITV